MDKNRNSMKMWSGKMDGVACLNYFNCLKPLTSPDILDSSRGVKTDRPISTSMTITECSSQPNNLNSRF